MTWEDREKAHFFVFVAHITKEHGQDKSKWRKAPPCGGKRKLPRRIGNPPLSCKEYMRDHDGCRICYGKNLPQKQDHKMCRTYAEPISKPTSRRCPKRSVWRLGSGGKVLVDDWEDKGMEVTADWTN